MRNVLVPMVLVVTLPVAVPDEDLLPPAALPVVAPEPVDELPVPEAPEPVPVGAVELEDPPLVCGELPELCPGVAPLVVVASAPLDVVLLPVAVAAEPVALEEAIVVAGMTREDVVLESSDSMRMAKLTSAGPA